MSERSGGAMVGPGDKVISSVFWCSVWGGSGCVSLSWSRLLIIMDFSSKFSEFVSSFVRSSVCPSSSVCLSVICSVSLFVCPFVMIGRSPALLICVTCLSLSVCLSVCLSVSTV